MIENLISGLYLLGDVGLLGPLVYNNHKSADRIKRDRIGTQRKKTGRVVAQRANRLAQGLDKASSRICRRCRFGGNADSIRNPVSLQGSSLLPLRVAPRLAGRSLDSKWTSQNSALGLAPRSTTNRLCRRPWATAR
jgi:hypothetical protein